MPTTGRSDRGGSLKLRASLPQALRVEPLDPVPDHLLGVRDELNLLSYGPSTVLLGVIGDELVGAIRYAVRDDARRQHGLLADLQVDADHRDDGVPEQLIRAAERQLRARGVRKFDALIRDSQGWAPHFYRLGYWASRKTVVMLWDLDRLRPAE